MKRMYFASELNESYYTAELCMKGITNSEMPTKVNASAFTIKWFLAIFQRSAFQDFPFHCVIVCIECMDNALYYQSHLHRYFSSQLWLVFRFRFCFGKMEEFLFFSCMEFVSSGYRSDLNFLFLGRQALLSGDIFFLYFFHDIVQQITIKHVVHDRKASRPPINSHSTVTTFIFERNVPIENSVEFPIPIQSDEV